MFRGRYRWLIRLALVLFIGMMGLVWAQREKERHQLTVENRSGHVLTHIEIKAGTDSKSFPDVADGVRVVAPFAVEKAEKYDIRIEFGKSSINHMQGVLGDSPHFIVLPGGQILPQPQQKR
jgi:hypothetical protein